VELDRDHAVSLAAADKSPNGDSHALLLGLRSASGGQGIQVGDHNTQTNTFS